MLAVVLALLGAAVGPGSAQAFVGENVVINPSTGELTAPAETIITNPTFLDEFEEVAAPAEKRSLSRVLMSSRALPMIGRVLPIVGGVFAANEVCNFLFDACVSFEDDGTSIAGPAVGKWEFTVQGSTGGDGAFTGENRAYYSPFGASYYIGVNVPSGCSESVALPPPPGGTSGEKQGELKSVNCGAPIGTIMARKTFIVRSWAEGWNINWGGGTGSTYTGSDYCRGWGGAADCQSTVGSDWSKQAATGLKEKVDPSVGQYVASQIKDSGVKNPYAVYVNVPDCDELKWGACAALLEGKELEPIREDLDWSEVVTDVPDAVTQTLPAGGSEVEVPSKVKVITNPDKDGMPLLIPSPEPGETYSEYIAKLSPGLDPKRVNVPEAYTDPSVGPNTVLRVQPDPGTKLNPATEHEVEIQTNPPTAPAPVPGGWSPPDIPPIDLEPISGIPSPCTVFPFGLFCWVGEAFAQFNTSGTCPHFSAPVAGTESNFAVTLCGETSETIMSYLRPALLLAFIVGCGFLFARGTRAVGGD